MALMKQHHQHLHHQWQWQQQQQQNTQTAMPSSPAATAAAQLVWLCHQQQRLALRTKQQLKLWLVLLLDWRDHRLLQLLVLLQPLQLQLLHQSHQTTTRLSSSSPL
jgi:hypothetical protein